MFGPGGAVGGLRPGLWVFVGLGVPGCKSGRPGSIWISYGVRGRGYGGKVRGTYVLQVKGRAFSGLSHI